MPTNNGGSFERYLIRGQLIPRNDDMDVDMEFAVSLANYKTANNIARQVVSNNPDFGSTKQDAEAAYKLVSNRVPVSYAEWIRTYYQSICDHYGYDSFVPTSSNKIIMPVVDSILFLDCGITRIHYGTDGRSIVFEKWLGVDHDVWQAITTIPGNIAAWERIADERGRYTYYLSVLCYSIMADTPNEFCLWLNKDLKYTGMDNKNNPSWVKET